jgi:two-component system response regulator DctR
MNFTDTPTVFIVDDDASVREGMAWLLRTRRLLSESFDSAEAFLAMVQGNGASDTADDGVAWQLDPALLQQSACILLDVRMPGMSGLALFEQLLAKGIAQAWPVIFLTGHADVPTAVDSVKRGAFDFCEKPFSDNALVDRVEQALALSQERLLARQTQQRLQSRLLELTERERDVMRLVVEGLPNKLIADQLDISVRTVEVHRARVFDKMEVKSAVELANLMRQLA